MSDSANPCTAACQAPLSMEFSRQEYWSGLPFSPAGDLPHPGIKPASPALAGKFFTTEPSEKPLKNWSKMFLFVMFVFEFKVLMKLVYIPCFYQDSLALTFLLAQALALPLTVFEFQTSVPLCLLSFRVFCCLFVCSKIPLVPADNDRMKNQFSSVQSLSRVWLFAPPWIAAHQASLSITNSWSLLKPMSIELVMPSRHLILCRPLLLLLPIPPNIRVFSNESTLCMRWLKYWSFIFSISPSSEHKGLISFRMDCLDLLAV